MPAQPSQDGPTPGTHEDRNARSSTSAGKPRAQRADALQNRARLVAAAHEAYAAHGIDVPVATIARRAGVGVATLYRHFPTRAALVAAAFEEQVARCAAVLDEAVADPDPWRGLRTVVEEVSAQQIAERGFTAAFLSRFPEDEVHRDHRNHERKERAWELLGELLARGVRAGAVRADVTPDDLLLLFVANSRLAAEEDETAHLASRRLVAHFLRSFRAAERDDAHDRTAAKETGETTEADLVLPPLPHLHLGGL